MCLNYTVKLRKRYGLFAFVILNLSLFLSACGGSSGSGENNTYLLGGSIQGNNLNLTAAVTTIVGTAIAIGSTDAIGAAARFNHPASITTDGANLYLADTDNHIIRKIVIATGEVTTIAGTALSSGSTDGTGAAARFTLPFGITTDGTNLYVADTDNNAIRQIVISTGEVTTLAGSTTGFADGIGAAAQFDLPSGITTDGTNLYVSDWGNHTIRKIVVATGVVTTIAGTALASGSTDATGATARFNNPADITIDRTNLYVTDYFNHTIRKIVISTGVVTTLAGTALTLGSADGIGAAASFLYPEGITTDGTNLYVADTSNQTIRQIVISTGVVTTLAGTVLTAGSTDGVGTAALFWNPYDITTEGTNLYVIDRMNNTIRKIN